MPLTIGLVGAGVGAIGTGVNLYNSYQERKRAQRQLNDLKNTPFEEYTTDPRYNQYYSNATNEAANAMGFTGGQKTNFTNMLNNNNNTVFANATRGSGGNLSRYISSALNANNVGAINNFVAQDAQLRLQNKNNALNRQGIALSQFQNTRNQNTAAKNARLQMLAQMAGAGIAQQNQNIAGAYNNFANLGFITAGYGLGSYGGGSGTPNGNQIDKSKFKFQYPDVDPNSPLFY